MLRSLKLILCFTLLTPFLLTGCVDKPSQPKDTTTTVKEESQKIAKQDTVEVNSNDADTTIQENEVALPDQGETPPVSQLLDIGSDAPPVQIASWVKGQPVTSFDSNRIYVVEFWATWCPPCKTSIPHLSKLQESYGDEVTFIGVTQESNEVVEAFLKKEAEPGVSESGKTWNDLMRYNVAIDDNGGTTMAYMRAANQRGIPAAFVVGYDGKVDWIGHPGEIDQPLKQIVARTWDRQEFLAERKEKAGLMERLTKLQSKLNQAAQNLDWDQALEVLDELEADMPESPRLTQIRLSLLLEAGRSDDALVIVRDLRKTYDKMAQPLNALAWSLASKEDLPDPILRETLVLAQRACELTGFANADALDTLARIHFTLGELDQAIAWQKQAVELEPEKDNLRSTLEEYQSHDDMQGTESAETELGNIEQPAA